MFPPQLKSNRRPTNDSDPLTGKEDMGPVDTGTGRWRTPSLWITVVLTLVALFKLIRFAKSGEWGMLAVSALIGLCLAVAVLILAGAVGLLTAWGFRIGRFFAAFLVTMVLIRWVPAVFAGYLVETSEWQIICNLLFAAAVGAAFAWPRNTKGRRDCISASKPATPPSAADETPDHGTKETEC